MTIQSKISFAVGYSIYAVLLYSILTAQPDVVMAFVSYLPAPLFATFILLFTPEVTVNRGFVFFILCCGLYYGELYIIINQINDENHYQLFIPLMSCLGAVAVSLVYTSLFKFKLNIKKDVFKAGIIGLQVSALTLITSFLQPFSNDMVDQLATIGFYSIFPFWTVSMNKHLLLKNCA